MKNPFIIINLAFLMLAISLTTVFINFSKIDLYFTNLFYSTSLHFFLKNNMVNIFIHDVVYDTVTICCMTCIIMLIIVAVTKKAIAGWLGNRQIIYLILALLIGPGIVVNTICKNNLFGRARPSQIVEFGGNKQFSPAMVISDQCQKNCSFPSGHASLGFYFTAIAFIAPKHKKLIFGLALIFGSVVGASRIVHGSHFISDIIFAALFVIYINYVLWWCIFGKKSAVS
jgi:lipid A 4'-phosphatase